MTLKARILLGVRDEKGEGGDSGDVSDGRGLKRSTCASSAGSGTVPSSDVDPLSSGIEGVERLREELGIALAKLLLLQACVVVEGKVDVQAGVTCAAVALSRS